MATNGPDLNPLSRVEYIYDLSEDDVSYLEDDSEENRRHYAHYAIGWKLENAAQDWQSREFHYSRFTLHN